MTLDQIYGCDLSTVENAWIEPNGRLHQVREWGHDSFAQAMGTTGDILIKKGWLRLSENGFDTNTVTQCQLDTIADWYMACGVYDDFASYPWKVV
jgi:hypothetical protein